MGARRKKKRIVKKGTWTKTQGSTKRDIERLLRAAQQTDRSVKYDPT